MKRRLCAAKFKHPGQVWPRLIGGITSSRCTNEDVYVVQKLIAAARQQ